MDKMMKVVMIGSATVILLPVVGYPVLVIAALAVLFIIM